MSIADWMTFEAAWIGGPLASAGAEDGCLRWDEELAARAAQTHGVPEGCGCRSGDDSTAASCPIAV